MGLDLLRVVRVPHRPDAGLKAFHRKFAAVRQPMLNFKTRFPDRDDSRFDRNQVADAHGSKEAGPGLDQRKAGEIGPLQEIAFREAYGLEDERSLRIEPFEESRVENDAGGVAVAPLDSPLPSRNDHHPLPGSWPQVCSVMLRPDMPT